jgi:SdrD B-like domain
MKYWTFLLSVLCIPTYAHSQTCTANQVGGVVFRDYNSNGVRDSLEAGIEGIQVSAFSQAGTQIATTQTDANGTYVLSVNSGVEVRVELGTLPSYLYTGVVGANNETTVRFLQANGSCVLDYALQGKSDYCGSSPSLATTCFAGGGVASTAPVVVDFPYESGTTSVTSNNGLSQPAYQVRANVGQVGSVRGLAYHRRANVLLASAHAKRHVPFSTSTDDTAPDAIWLISRNGAAPSLFFSREAGDDNHDYTNIDNDLALWDDVGKVGWGDIDFDEAENNLYAVNLFSKTIYRVPVVLQNGVLQPSNPTQISLASTAALCANNNWVPGAVKAKDGKLYFSITCTAETSQQRSDLRGLIVAYDPVTSIQTLVASISLDYPRSFLSRSGSLTLPGDFLPWSLVPAFRPERPFNQKGYPQPWLTDIEFNEDGNLVLGISDRAGDQYGNQYSGTGIDEGVVGGDIVLLRRSGTGWTFTVGDDEFYSQERYTISSSAPSHAETALGGLSLVLGRGEIVSNAFDPGPVGGNVRSADGTQILSAGTYRAGGLIYLSHTTGLRTRSYQIYGLDDPGTFGKAAGIGDVEALCQIPPVEIGNRLWLDTDSDGTQDAGERGIPSVQVELFNPSTNQVVATAVTNAQGNYYFDSQVDDGNSSNNRGGGMALDTPYLIRVALNQSPLQNYSLTRQGTVSSSSTDSNASATSGYAIISVPAKGFGENDHTLDIGFVQGSVEVGDTLWLDANRNGVLDTGESGIEGINVALIDSSSRTVATTTTNAQGGYRFDSDAGLTPQGSFRVSFGSTADYQTGGPLFGLSPTSTGQGTSLTDSSCTAVAGVPSISFTSPPLGSVDVTHDCGVIPTTAPTDYNPLRLTIDSQAGALYASIRQSLSLRSAEARSKVCPNLPRTTRTSLALTAKSLYEASLWQPVWYTLGRYGYASTEALSSRLCPTRSFASELTALSDSLTSLRGLITDITKGCSSSKRLRSRAKSVRRLYEKGIASLNQYPSTIVRCNGFE